MQEIDDSSKYNRILIRVKLDIAGIYNPPATFRL